MEAGYIKVYRKLIESSFYSDSESVHLWIHLLLSACYSENKFYVRSLGKEINLSSGQFITSIRQLAEQTNINKSKVERILKDMKNRNEIETKTVNGLTCVSIKNWNLYQKSETANETVNETVLEDKYHCAAMENEDIHKKSETVNETVNETEVRQEQELKEINTQKENIVKEKVTRKTGNTKFPFQPDQIPDDCKQISEKKGMTPETMKIEWCKFCLHFEKKLQKDWKRTWLTWNLNWVSWGSKQTVTPEQRQQQNQVTDKIREMKSAAWRCAKNNPGCISGSVETCNYCPNKQRR